MKCDLDDTLNSLRLGFQVIDSSWRYVYLNPAAAAHGRRSAFDLLGRTIMEMYPGIEDTELFERLCCSMLGRVCQQFDILFTFPDGEERWFDIRIEPVSEGICVYSLDIHERKLQQLALEAENARLLNSLPAGKRLFEVLVRRLHT